MGFYSFYKIFKDIIKTIFGKKFYRGLLIILIVLALLSFFKYNASYAGQILINDNTYTISDDVLAFKNIFIVEYIPDITQCAIYFSNGDFSFEVIGNKYYVSSTDVFYSGRFRLVGQTSNTPNISNFTLSRATIHNVGTNVTVDTSSNSLDGTLQQIVYCNCKIYEKYTGNVIYDGSPYIEPHFDNTDTDIQNLSFEWLYIDPADFGTDEPLYFHLLGVIDSVASGNDIIFYYNDVSYKLDKKSKYFIESEPTDYYSIPRYKLSLSLNSVYFFVISSDGSKINQSTNAITTDYDGVYQVVSVNTTGILTQDDINNNNIKSITESSEDTLNEITDSHIDNDFAESLPTDNVQDITSSGIDTIFSSIYNAFTSGTAQDIVFPVPFTDKSITLKATYVSDFLLEYCSWVYALIQAFWGYLIGRFIVTDVMKKMTAIKSGNFDKIQNNNIKGEML